LNARRVPVGSVLMGALAGFLGIIAATEAPRGLLYHRYRLEPDGTIADACIVPPTSQNLATIEEDLTQFIGGWLDLPSGRGAS